MIQNLKVDIIYHLTPSDFEMEFNLCGCCRMRLLSDKTNDKKSFVRALARDVARSRVIIVCGPLFGAESIITTVGTAIGNGLAICDNKTYGIKSEDEIKIINGSTPLVTPEGYFGGCIIESGPQTIISLTENKAFRKSIMQNLIHPYIEEISYIPTKTPLVTAPVQEEETEFETAISESENYISEVEEYESEPQIQEGEVLPVPTDEHNIEFIMDGEDETDQAEPEKAKIITDDYKLMYTEVETEAEIKSRYAEPYVPSESDNMFLSTRMDDGDEIKHKKEKKEKTTNITIVLLIMILALSILAIVYLLVLRPITMGVDVGEYIQEIFGIANENTLV